MTGMALRLRVEFPFADEAFPSDLGGFISRTALEGSAPILYVAHLHDNAWVMTDAQGDPNDEGALLVACVWHVISQDPTLADAASLPIGWEAVRDWPGEPWRGRPFDEE
jgi:hypothetical protein